MNRVRVIYLSLAVCLLLFRKLYIQENIYSYYIILYYIISYHIINIVCLVHVSATLVAILSEVPNACYVHLNYV